VPLIVLKPYANLTVSPFNGVDLSKSHDDSDNFIRASPGTRRVLEMPDQVRNKDREFGFVRKRPGVPLWEFQLGHLNFRRVFGRDSTTARHVRNVSIITKVSPKKDWTRFHSFIHNKICNLPRDRKIYSSRGWTFLRNWSGC
jgi:hypothetical protein